MLTPRAAQQQALQDLTVGEVLLCLDMEPATVPVDEPVDEVLSLVSRFSRPRRLYVLDDDQRLCGVIDPETRQGSPQGTKRNSFIAERMT